MAAPNIIAIPASQNVAVAAQTADADGGTIEIQDAANVVLAVFALGSPAWDVPVSGVAALAGAPLVSAPAVAAGAADHYVVKTSGALAIWTGTIGNTSSFNLTMLDVNIVLTQTVAISALDHHYG